MDRRDVTSPRTPSDLEHRYGFGQSFAELMGVSNDARILAEQAEETAKTADEKASEALRVVNANSGTLSQVVVDVEGVKAEVVGLDGVKAKVELALLTDGNGNLESAVHIGANKLTITTDYFQLTEKGKIVATGGDIGGWDITEDYIYKHYIGLKKTGVDETEFVSSDFYIAPPKSNDISYVMRLVMGRDEVFHILNNGEISSNKIISSYTETGFSRSASLEDGILNLYSSVMVSEGYELAYYQYSNTRKFMIYVDKADSIVKAKQL